MADDLNYWDGQAWNETKPEFDLLSGYASASKARHSVQVPGNLVLRRKLISNHL